MAFDLLPASADLRALRTRILEQNIVGFYDERPGKKKLYAVSEDKKLTPANQLILSHELRHALQDQYADLHGMLPESVGDFDDRRMAFLSVLEGDATLVMERFMVRRMTGDKGDKGDKDDKEDDMPSMSMPPPPMPDIPPVLRDQLLLPYFSASTSRRPCREGRLGRAQAGLEPAARSGAGPPEVRRGILLAGRRVLRAQRRRVVNEYQRI